MRAGAAEPLLVDLLAGDALDHIRTGDEYPAGGCHDDQICERWTVGCAASRGTDDDGDLWHPTRSPDHGGEHLADPVQRRDALGELRPTGVPYADNGPPFPYREVDRRHDGGASLHAHRPGHDRAVGAVGDDRLAVDAPAHGVYPVAVRCARRAVQADHRPGVQQLRQAHLGVAMVPLVVARQRLGCRRGHGRSCEVCGTGRIFRALPAALRSARLGANLAIHQATRA